MSTPHLRFNGFTEDWQNTTVENHYTNISTNSFSRSCLNYENGQVKNIHYGDIHTKLQSHVDASVEIIPYINEEENYLRYLETSFCKEKDLIFADASEDLNDIGKCIEIINTNNEKILSGLHTIHLRNYTDYFYIGFGGYLFKTNRIVKQIQRESQGAKVLGISSRKILNLEINIPSIQEQEKIASFFTIIDEKLKLLKEKKEKLELYKKGVMQQIFSQKLRFKDEKGNEFPEWEEKKLGDICEISKGKQLNVENMVENGLFPALNGGINYSGYTNSWNTEKETITISEGGNSCGFVSFINENFWCGGHCYALKEIKVDVKKKFLFQYLKYNELSIMRMRVGSGLPNIQKKGLNEFPIQIPHLKEQQKIANFLSALDSKINLVSTQIEKTELWKKGLLQQMFV